MKLYITKEQKEELESEIEELRVKAENAFTNNREKLGWLYSGNMDSLLNILSEATVIPAYDSLGKAMQDKKLTNPEGVIILNKNT